ncbi:MAG: 2-methylcitrate dehydratase FeS dependent (EC [uncultured Paraburkholderia sp.]|nr:MAG: 2-methylcitrate dehydratase FeS dependent (EC [uncultured Paraburkholderia sp.]
MNAGSRRLYGAADAPRHLCLRFITDRPQAMNTAYRKRLPGTELDFFDARRRRRDPARRLRQAAVHVARAR